MRKTIGWVSLVLQLITVLGAVAFLAITTGPNISFSDGAIVTICPLIPLYVWAMWAGMSVGSKTAMIKKVEYSLGFIPTIFGIITIVFYLVIYNPGPSFPSSTIGLVIVIALFVFFMVDLIDAAYQKTCKL